MEEILSLSIYLTVFDFNKPQLLGKKTTRPLVNHAHFCSQSEKKNPYPRLGLWFTVCWTPSFLWCVFKRACFSKVAATAAWLQEQSSQQSFIFSCGCTSWTKQIVINTVRDIKHLHLSYICADVTTQTFFFFFFNKNLLLHGAYWLTRGPDREI